MPRYETTIPVIPRGAGRFMDCYWPAVTVSNHTTGASFAADNNVRIRSGGTTNTLLSQTTGGAGATCQVQYQNGRPCIRFNAAGAGSSFKIFGGAGFVAGVRDLAGGPSFNGRTPQNLCWRFQYVLAFSNNATNCGVTVGAVDPANPFVAGNRAGFRLAVDGANGLLMQARRTSGAALTLNQTIAGSDARNWNHVDVRWCTATNLQNAYWRVLLNGTQVTLSDVGTSAVFPLSQDGVNRLTLNMMWGIETGGTGSMYVALPNGIQISGAFNEAGLL